MDYLALEIDSGLFELKRLKDSVPFEGSKLEET